jgi:hypothetical protein
VQKPEAELHGRRIKNKIIARRDKLNEAYYKLLNIKLSYIRKYAFLLEDSCSNKDRVKLPGLHKYNSKGE